MVCLSISFSLYVRQTLCQIMAVSYARPHLAKSGFFFIKSFISLKIYYVHTLIVKLLKIKRNQCTFESESMINGGLMASCEGFC